MPSVRIDNFPKQGLSTLLNSAGDLVKFLEKIPQEKRMAFIKMPEITALIQSIDLYGVDVYKIKWKKRGEKKDPNTVYLHVNENTVWGAMYASKKEEFQIGREITDENYAILRASFPAWFHAEKKIEDKNLIRHILQKAYERGLTSLHGTTTNDFANLLALLPQENWQEVMGLYQKSDRSIAAWSLDKQIIMLKCLFSDFAIASTSSALSSEQFTARLQCLGMDQISEELAVAWCKSLTIVSFQLLMILFPSEESSDALFKVLLGILSARRLDEANKIPDEVFNKFFPSLKSLTDFLSRLEPVYSNIAVIAQQYFRLNVTTAAEINQFFSNQTISAKLKSALITGYCICAEKTFEMSNMASFVDDIDLVRCLQNLGISRHYYVLRLIKKPFEQFLSQIGSYGFTLFAYLEEKLKESNEVHKLFKLKVVIDFCKAIISVRDALNNGNYLPEKIGNDWFDVLQELLTTLHGKRRSDVFLTKAREVLDSQYARQSCGHVVTINFTEEPLSSLEDANSSNSHVSSAFRVYNRSDTTTMYNQKNDTDADAGAGVEIELQNLNGRVSKPL